MFVFVIEYLPSHIHLRFVSDAFRHVAVLPTPFDPGVDFHIIVTEVIDGNLKTTPTSDGSHFRF